VPGPDPGAGPLPVQGAGLCAVCVNAMLIESGKGSRFILCEESRRDPEYPKYPRLPVRECAAFRRRGGPDAEAGKDVP